MSNSTDFDDDPDVMFPENEQRSDPLPDEVGSERCPLKTPLPSEENTAAELDDSQDDAPKSEVLPNGWKSECGAKTRNGKTCRRPPVAGRTRCRLHGGASLAGAAHPAFKHGRRCKFLKHLPKEMREGYEAAVNDEELTSLKDEIALLEVREAQLLGEMKNRKKKSPPWGKAVEAMNDVKTARGPKARAAAQVRLEKIIRQGAAASKSQDELWDKLGEIMERKARLSSTEWRRLHDLNYLIPADQALGFLQAMIQAGKDTITNRQDYMRFYERLIRLLPHGPNSPDRVVIENEPDADD